jgi:hypothetical protein
MKFSVPQSDIDLHLVLIEHRPLEVIVAFVVGMIRVSFLVDVLSNVQELAHEVELDFVFALREQEKGQEVKTERDREDED